ncbi:carbamoyltransferase, partial [Candidatus Parcubacteria bacterium]
MKILGVNAWHGDSAASLVVDGTLIAAAEEERFRRIKHWAGFPSEAIRYCLKEGGITLADVDVVAINSDPNANLLKKISFTLRSRPEFGLIMDRLRNQKERLGIADEFERAFPRESFRAEVRHVEHHLAHLASAFYVSPCEEAVVVSVDGFGDFASAAWGVGNRGGIDIEGRVYYPHSLGVFYQALTQFLGFPNYGDEYKVMGLAPYGKPAFMDEMRQIVRLQDDGSFQLDMDYFVFHKEKIAYEWDNGSPKVGRLFSDKLV